MRELSYREALNEALVQAMDADPDVILIGEDIGTYGGAFGVTRGLLDRYGTMRVIDTPISEAPALARRSAACGLWGTCSSAISSPWAWSRWSCKARVCGPCLPVR